MATIKQLSASDVEAAKAVIVEVCLEFFGSEPNDFCDMDEVSSQYTAPQGRFLLLMDGDCVVGTGAIRAIDRETCELKRMYFLPPYRGKGHGRKMAEMLLDFARAAGYRRVRLDTDPKLIGATRLYEKLGFHHIERYNDGPCSIFMEKDLER